MTPTATDLTNRAWETSIEAARANTLNSSVYMVNLKNQELIDAYNSNFDAWKEMVVAGQRDTSNPPQPPSGWRLSAPNEHGFIFYERGTEPVCPARTDIPVVNPVAPSWFENPDIRNVPPGDTTPVGAIVTAPDGSRWQKMSNNTPFGVATWYQRVG